MAILSKCDSYCREVLMQSNHKLALWFRRLSATLIATGALTVVGFAADFDGNWYDRWVGTWGTSLHEPDLGVPGLANTGFNNQTLRQIVHTSVGAVRFAFGCPLSARRAWLSALRTSPCSFLDQPSWRGRIGR